jgi:hypothetical protein
MGARTPEDLVSLRDRGFTFLGYASDYFLLLDAAQRGIETLGHAASAAGR